MGMLPGVGTPGFAGLSAAAARGLQLSGYQDRPITTGQVLGEMMGAGMKAYQEQKKSDLADRIAMAKLAQPSDFAKKIALAAIDPSTPEGQAMVQKMLMKPDTVFMGGDEQKKEAYKAALAARKEMLKQSNADRELGVRLDTAINLLEAGVPTGRLTAAMLPLKQLAREAGVLGDEELKNLSNQEIIDSVAAFLTPRMRVVGSGASSDRDMDFFARATVRMANTPEANLVIAKMQKQVMDYNKKRLDLFDDYVKKNGDDFGFGRFADEELGQVYQKFSTDEELAEAIERGLIKEGDVFFNNMPRVGEFDILTKENDVMAKLPTQRKYDVGTGRTQMDVYTDIARAAIGQGMGFGFADELEAAVRSMFTDKTYDETVKQIRADIESFRETDPIKAYGAEIAGSIITGGGLARLGAQKLAGTALSGTQKAAVIGAGESAVYGAGAGEGVSGKLSGAIVSAPIGAVTAGLGQK